MLLTRWRASAHKKMLAARLTRCKKPVLAAVFRQPIVCAGAQTEKVEAPKLQGVRLIAP